MTKNNKISVYQDLLLQKKKNAEAIKNIEQSIIDDIQDDIDSQLKDKDYNCGTANIEYQGYTLKVSVGKKIDYDQDVLSEIAKRIVDSDTDLTTYMKTIYKVSENNFKNWSKPIQKEFVKARSVKPNKPKIEIKE